MPFPSDPSTTRVLLATGALGAFLLFVADLVLYYPSSKPEHRSAKSYFDKIDPGGNHLAESSMQEISNRRVMLGGVMGPVAAVFYNIGFIGVFLGLQDVTTNEEEGVSKLVLPLTAALGFSFQMTIASLYHAIFAYTCFISKEIAKEKKESSSGNDALLRLISIHRDYLKYIYKWCAVPGLLGSIAFVWCCLSTKTMYAPATVCFTPALSAFVKKFLKQKSIGGLVLCGGLTNLWNLCFFFILNLSIAAQ
jgi:hypothetical protein